MEVYVLDDQLRRTAVIDRFESMIWTERYSSYGDFQLVIHSTPQSRGLLVANTWIKINKSRRVMMIENVVNKDDSSGRSLLTITGRSLEALLLGRVNRSSLPTGSAVAMVTLTGTPGNMARSLFTSYCTTANTNQPNDAIPFYTAGNLYPTDTIAEPSTSLTLDFEVDWVYNSIKNLLDAYGLGFRLYTGPDDSKLYFNVYSGSDRTTSQTGLPAVVFSPDLENLTDISELTSVEQLKNVAYVMAPNGNLIVYADGVDSSIAGFDRKILFVKADDITLAAGAPLNAALLQRGKDELSKNKAMYALDGELPKTNKYIYEYDYYLGDLIEMRNNDGLTNNMQVTEQIFVDDSEGERSYPTLTLNEFITPGSWLAWDYNEVWDAVPDTDFWSTI
jgi:hypothetical protein